MQPLTAKNLILWQANHPTGRNIMHGALQMMIIYQDLPEPWHVNLQKTSSKPRSKCEGDDSRMHSNFAAIDCWRKFIGLSEVGLDSGFGW